MLDMTEASLAACLTATGGFRANQSRASNGPQSKSIGLRQSDRKQAVPLGIPLLQKLHVGAYLIRQQLAGRKRYPLVLMLEPLFRCNLACAGCGKIDYPDEILNQRISVADALEAVDECGAPVVSIAGGEPLLHKELPTIVKGIIERRKFVYLCTNALLMQKRMKDYQPSPYFVWSVHLDGDKEDHDKSVCQAGTYDRAIAAIKEAKARGFRCNINCTLFNNADPERMANFFDSVMAMGVDGITVSPGYAYERAPDQQHFLNRQNTKQLFRDIFKRGNGGKKWSFSQSPMFLDFLAGNQTYHCTPWGNPTRTVFGWQKPCYLLGEGYAKTFDELMEIDRLGCLRRRQLREVRRLHGAFGLRGNRRAGHLQASDQGVARHAAGHDDRGRDGAGNLPGKPAPGTICVLPPCRRATH